MNTFYIVLDLLYKINKKYPEISFGTLIHSLTTNQEKLWYLSDEELIKRFEELLKDDNE